MKKLTLLLTVLIASASFANVNFEGADEMSKAMLQGEKLNVTEIEAGEIYRLKGKLFGENVDSECYKSQRAHGMTIYSCENLPEDLALDIAFWQQYGVQKMVMRPDFSGTPLEGTVIELQETN